MRLCQSEAWNVLARGKTRQIVVLLFSCAVMEQQFGGAERIGHHQSACNRNAAAGYFCHDCRVGDCGETKTTMFLRNDHSEEALAFEKVPDLVRKLAILRDLPVVNDTAEIIHGPFEKRLFTLR